MQNIPSKRNNTTENQNVKRQGPHDDRQYYLHDFLKQYMEVENKLMGIFYDGSEAAAYSTLVYWNGGAYDRESGLYATFGDCISAWRDDWDEEDGVVKTYVYKRWLRSKENPNEKWMRAQLLPDSDKISKIRTGGDILTEEEMNLFSLFETFWIYVPVPFQKGDIVYAPWSQGVFCPSDYIPCVLEHICYQGRDAAWIEHERQHADYSDMTAWCYFLVYLGVTDEGLRLAGLLTNEKE